MTQIDPVAIAKEVSTVDEAVMRVLPTIAMFAGFVPGASVITGFEPEIMELLQALDGAAKAVADGNPGAAFGTIVNEIKNHLTPGKGNSIFLGPNPPILQEPTDPTPTGQTS